MTPPPGMVKGFTQTKVVFSEPDVEVNQLFILLTSLFSCHHFDFLKKLSNKSMFLKIKEKKDNCFVAGHTHSLSVPLSLRPSQSDSLFEAISV